MTLAKGIVDYIEREAEEHRDFALCLLQEDLSVEEVARYTGLTVEEVRRLRCEQLEQVTSAVPTHCHWDLLLLHNLLKKVYVYWCNELQAPEAVADASGERMLLSVTHDGVTYHSEYREGVYRVSLSMHGGMSNARRHRALEDVLARVNATIVPSGYVAWVSVNTGVLYREEYAGWRDRIARLFACAIDPAIFPHRVEHARICLIEKDAKSPKFPAVQFNAAGFDRRVPLTYLPPWAAPLQHEGEVFCPAAGKIFVSNRLVSEYLSEPSLVDLLNSRRRPEKIYHKTVY